MPRKLGPKPKTTIRPKAVEADEDTKAFDREFKESRASDRLEKPTVRKFARSGLIFSAIVTLESFSPALGDVDSSSSSVSTENVRNVTIITQEHIYWLLYLRLRQPRAAPWYRQRIKTGLYPIAL